MPKAKVTRDDVAREAGTSVAVVSYVVNNGPRAVAPDTRARVLAAIEKTGYRPDHIARALASGRTGTYGLIIPNIANPFVASLAHAIEDEAFRSGHSILLGDSADNPEREAELITTFLQQRIDGLIFYGVDRSHPWLSSALGTVPVVVLDDTDPDPGAVCVRIDERAAAAAATAHLVSHGHRRIATIAGPLAQQNAQDRLAGWRDALATAGMPASDALIVEADYTREAGYRAAAAMLGRGDRPDAVFLANEPQAMGFLAAAHDLGVRVPDDVAIVCLNGTIHGEYAVPALSTVEHPVRTVAAHAVAALGDGTAQQRTIVCDFRVVPRRSCGCSYARATADHVSAPAEEVRP